jgi:hypothetical protein
MTVLGGFPLFSFFSSQSRSERLRKSIGPLSSVIKRQQISHRAIQNAKKNNEPEEVVTENSILNNFPRPNLMPTLQFSLFGFQQAKTASFTRCNNCSGPHSTDYCPC